MYRGVDGIQKGSIYIYIEEHLKPLFAIPLKYAGCWLRY